MHRLEKRMRVLLGLWVLAGLMVAGINGTMLLQLLDEPLAGYSMVVRNASRGFEQYRVLLATEARKITSGMDLLASRYTLPAVKEEKKAAPDVSVRQTAGKAAPVSVALPTLTGIMTSRSTDGATQRLAVMDGRICNEGDRLGDLTVKGISRTGVRLAKGGRTWFIKAPEVAYSLTSR